MKTNPSNPEKFVREQHRVRQGMLPSATAAVGLAATLCLIWFWHRSFAPVENWSRLRPCWIAGIALTVVSALVIWRWRRRSLLNSAVQLDVVLASSNRLETVTEFRNANDPLARAQREETESFLARTPATSRRGMLSALRMVVLLLTLAHAATLLCWARPWNYFARTPDAPTTAKAANRTEAASLEWKSPESETKATVIEEVPLEAEADSTSGLRDVTLEVAVNGEQQFSQPLTNDVLKQPGKHLIKTSLYLDQLEVKPFDVISYHLRAQRGGSTNLPPTVSPVQFVQVKPMRDETRVSASDKPDRSFNHITALKAAQLRLMKENFNLAHAEIGHDHPDWRETNDRVAGEQGELARRTAETVEFMSTNGYPPEILELVRQARPLMMVAAGRIEDRENESALPPQGKALGYLAEVEKYLKKQIVLGRNERPKARDPFETGNIPDLKQPPLTLAAKVDQLAAEQAKLAADLSQTNAMPAQRQVEIKQRIADLLKNEGMEPEALKHLQAGHDQAGASQASLERNDVPAAREPAATSARELRQTANVLRQAAGEMAKDELADALYKLAQAAKNVRRASQLSSDAEARTQLEQAEAALREAAERLAEAGRAQAEQKASSSANQLNNLSKRLQDESLQKLLNESRAQPRDAVRNETLASRLDQIADQVAQQRQPASLSNAELARLAERMERARANLQRLASSQEKSGAPQKGNGSEQAGQNAAEQSGEQEQQGSQKSNQAQNPSTSDNSNKSEQGQTGQSGQSGQLGESGQSGQQGQSGGQQSGQNQQASRNSKSDKQSQQGKQGITGSTAKSGGGGQSGQPSTSQSTTSSEELEQQFAEQLLDELRADALNALSVEGTSGDVTKMRNILGRGAGASLGLNRLPGLFKEIDSPLRNVIRLVRAEVSNARRPHQLIVAEVEQAPPAYRPAVADYFERLSRDYEPAKGANNAAEK